MALAGMFFEHTCAHAWWAHIKAKVKALVYRLISSTMLFIRRHITSPSSACSFHSPSHLPGEDTAQVSFNLQLIVLTRLLSHLGAHLQLGRLEQCGINALPKDITCCPAGVRPLGLETNALTIRPHVPTYMHRFASVCLSGVT